VIMISSPWATRSRSRPNRVLASDAVTLSIALSQSLSEKSEMVGGEGFWLCARRTVPRIPTAGCKERSNEAHRQKHRRRPVPIFQNQVIAFAPLFAPSALFCGSQFPAFPVMCSMCSVRLNNSGFSLRASP
jgi:hypothetical protein